MKVRNQNIERPPAHSQVGRRRGSSLNSFLAGAATVLLLLASAGGYLLYRAMEQGDVKNPFSPNQTATGNTASVEPANTAPAAPAPASIAPGQFVQPSLGSKAQVELVSVRRMPQNPGEVKVEMRINVLDDMDGGEMLDVSQTSARNPVTNDIYPPADPQTRSSGLISLLDMRQGQSVDASVVLKVPQDVSNIDIFVHETSAFRNVPVAVAGAGSNAQNSSPVNPSGGTPAAQPTATATPAPVASAESQPKPVVRRAYGTKAQVELLSVKRVEDPKTGNRDVVNVQMRIRRLEEQLGADNMINVGETTARNPQTTETYKAIDPAERSTGSVSLSNMPKGGSADAYVWLRVPPTANTIDIYVPQTAAFNRVAISE